MVGVWKKSCIFAYKQYIDMATNWEGGGPTKPQLKLDGNKVIVENIGVYDGSIPTYYRKETIYHFDNEDKAMEYYYKKR